jgi:hypothetical protein
LTIIKYCWFEILIQLIKMVLISRQLRTHARTHTRTHAAASAHVYTH